ncbi:polymorphic toxin-type HINT domain-containing protein [Micromonospora sp. NPDC047730]|uniref:polymorphic toxin-type HINT domain-containing protein n=1 Tax=Micromonospora sp. NPDC047730 TaxID=3364253 RepID=UPI00371C0857
MTEPGDPQQSNERPPDGAVSSASPGRRRKALLFGCAGLVLALVAGLVVWLNLPTPERNREPFDQAVASLGNARGVRYTGAATDAAFTGKQTRRDITVTAHGEQYGTVSVPDLNMDLKVLRVGGRVYGYETSNGRWARWRTGGYTRRLLGPMSEQLVSPGALADQLSEALDALPRLPAPEDPDLPALSVDGVPALRADTAAGTLLVAKDPPYRVLRLEPGTETPRSGQPQPTGQDEAPSDAAAFDSLDIAPLSDGQAEQMYDTLAAETAQLAGAEDADVDFALEGDGTLKCRPSGCHVRQSFTGTLSTDAATRITAGQITVSMTVTMDIEGRRAGGCSSPPRTLPLTGNTVSGQQSCSAPEAGPVWAAVDAEKRARAKAESRATGRSVTYTVRSHARAEVIAQAVTKVEVDRLLERQRQQRNSTECPTPNSFVPGTLVLLADGSARPIERVTPGVRVRATDPVTGRTTGEPVLAQITGGGPKHLDQLTVTDGRQTGTVTATAGHPFWNPDRRAWIDAGDLRPGAALAGPPGSRPVRVTGMRAYQRNLTVHNLTVANVHTFYVLAGDTPVLVHNCAMKRGAKALKGIKVPNSYEGLDIAHVRRNHVLGGAGVTSGKDLWPAKITDAELESIARAALRNNPRVVGYDPETRMVQATAVVDGRKVRFQIPRGGGRMRSIYPQ